jgi:hypothetical protein
MNGRGQALRNLRVEARGIVQMLLLAILLQLSFPVSASLAGTAGALSLDDGTICSSQPGQAGQADHGAQADAGVPHCVFCLPLLSMAATPVDSTALPVPHEAGQEAALPVAPLLSSKAVALSGDARAPPVLR